MRYEAGETVDYTVTFLEMEARPAYPRPSVPSRPRLALLKAEDAPVRHFLDLYRAVGADWEWNDRLRQPRAEVEAFVSDPAVVLYTLMVKGWTGGFFMLDHREEGTTDLAYFGLVPEAGGQGLGTWLLQTAIHAGWDIPGTRRMSVNTCTLDHPRALPLYQKHGFAPVRQKTAQMVLSAPRDIT